MNRRGHESPAEHFSSSEVLFCCYLSLKLRLYSYEVVSWYYVYEAAFKNSYFSTSYKKGKTDMNITLIRSLGACSQSFILSIHHV